MTTTVKLSAEQEEIRGVARGFLQSRFPSDKVRELMATEDGFEQDVWQEIAELGWTAIAIPEDRGGAGFTTIERCLLLEEMGRVLYAGPFLSSAVLAADALLLAADEELAEAELAAVADGSVRATLIAGGDLLGSGDPVGQVVATEAGDGWSLSGDGGLVLDGLTAQRLIVAARIEGGTVGLFAVDPADAGVEREAAPTIDQTRRTATVRFAGAAATRLDRGERTEEGLAETLDRGAVAIAAEAVGGARQAIEMTVAYMTEREQFGGPIGRFQALKHRLADLHVMIDAAREAVYNAADATESGDHDHVPMAAAAAKSSASDGYALTTAEAVQLHGGIGFTEEHDIGLYYKRALVGVPILGTPLAHRERIAAGMDV
ncbi:MAG TPA: acyl-CoA dehydrogenase family protein [Solirubrobacterales bacterium]|nr:acyl-CoA dehydrogenase family protein [Solirubrobacterales bacterium]